MISFFNNNCDCSSLWSFIPSCPKCNDDGEVRNCEDEGYIRPEDCPECDPAKDGWIRPEDCPECPDCEDLGYIKDPRTEGWIKPEDCLSCEEQGYIKPEDCGNGAVRFTYSHSASDGDTANNFLKNLTVDCSALNFGYKANLRNMFKDFGGSLKRLDQLKFNHIENFSNCFENALLILRPGDPGYGIGGGQYWLDFTNWDMQYATNINEMFKNVNVNDYNTRFLNMSGWDLSQLKEINGTFFSLYPTPTYFNTIDLSNWSFPSLTKIDGKEDGFIKLNGYASTQFKVYMDGWNLDNVEVTKLFSFFSYSSVTIYVRNCSEITVEKIREQTSSFSKVKIVTE